MTCDEIKTMLAAYADGELAPIEADGVVAHLEQCGRCRQIVRDQQQVQHVLNSYHPPPVSDEQWDAIGRRLRAELEGKGDRAVLKTRARVDVLEPTPIGQPALSAEETRSRTPRESPAPALRPHLVAYGVSPSLTVMKVRTRRRRAPFGWVAHVVGALAACLVIGLGLAGVWTQAVPLGPNALARQNDVAIMEVQLLAQDYSVAYFPGDADDVAALWVVPNEENC